MTEKQITATNADEQIRQLYETAFFADGKGVINTFCQT
jgi:hypothetical protein